MSANTYETKNSLENEKKGTLRGHQCLARRPANTTHY